jgi:glycosyltransferase involved in cell wall biosynthesis
MPSLDQGEFLEAALRSVLLQDGPEVELIVVDGGSRDGSVEVLEKYDPWLSRWTSEPDRGQAHAINKGFARATGDAVGWLNSDDLLLPGALDRIAAAFVRRGDVSVVCGFRKVLDAGGAFVRNWVRDLPTAHYLRHYCCVAQETVYWRREVLERLGPLDESFHYALDYDYWLRMLAAGYELTPLPAYLGAFREHPSSKTASRLDLYHLEMHGIYRHYGMGRNEEEVQRQLGEAWFYRLALLEDLCETRAFGRAGVALAFLRLLERPRAGAAAAELYRRYRAVRPRGSGAGSRVRAAAAALAGGLLRTPVPGTVAPKVLRSSPLGRTRLTGAEAAELPAEELEPDGLAVGAGWSFVETSSGRVYRWADNDAEIVVTRPSGKRRCLRIDLESGPSLDWQPYPLEVLDEDGRVLLRRTMAPRDFLSLPLSLEAGERFRCIRLRVPSRGRPASAADSRVLNFRATHIAFIEASDDDGEGSKTRSPHPGLDAGAPPGLGTPSPNRSGEGARGREEMQVPSPVAGEG